MLIACATKALWKKRKKIPHGIEAVPLLSFKEYILHAGY